MANFIDIAPALGRGLDFAQGFPGGYDAIDLRRAMSLGLQEGPVTAGAYKVTQKSTGANMSVDVATDQGAFLVQGDDVANQGLYHVAPTVLKANIDVSAADATNPRVDQVVLEARDDAHKGDGITRARVYVLAGTPTSGATLDNAAGVTSRAAVPSSTALLAEFIVAANAVTISTASIRDRRSAVQGQGQVQPVLTALPAGPVDGQEILYLADATLGIIWRFRYRTASASTYKWEFIGGTEFSAYTAGDVTRPTGSVYADVGPSITVPLAGEYIAQTHAESWNDAAASGTLHGPAFNAVAPVGGEQGEQATSNGGYVFTTRSPRIRKAIAASQIVSIYGAAYGSIGHFRNRRLTVIPARVG